jgi:hypothetical protein
MDLEETGWGGVDWIDLSQDSNKWRARDCGNETSGSIKCWETIEGLHNWWTLHQCSAPKG